MGSLSRPAALVLRIAKTSPALYERLCRRWNVNTLEYWNKLYAAADASEHWRSPARLQFYDFAAAAIPKQPATILDVGSGLGWGAAHIASKCSDWHVDGLDFSAEACRKAVVKTHCVDLRSDDLPRQYDYVLAVETLEHFGAPMAVLQKLYKGANKAVILTVPYKGNVTPLHPFRFDENVFDTYANVRVDLCQRRDQSTGQTKTDMRAFLSRQALEVDTTMEARDLRTACLTSFVLVDTEGSPQTHLDLGRCDPHLFFAKSQLPPKPIIVEVGSMRGIHATELYKRLQGQVIVYEASVANHARLVEAVSTLPIITDRAAVTGTDGEVDFFEFEEPSSSSIYPRHQKENKRLQKRIRVRAVSVEQILKENHLSRIDVLFTNCEGSELGIIEEILAKRFLRSKIGQICVSFHGGRIYPRVRVNEAVERMSEWYLVIEDNSKWACHLFVNKSLL